MCTEKDIETGKTKHTFIGGYKKEHRVMTDEMVFLPYYFLYRLGDRINLMIKPMTYIGALDLCGAMLATCVK